MADTQFQEQLIRRLNILIRLLLEAIHRDGKPNVTKLILQLHAMGLPPSEIAAVLGKPVNQVTSALAKKRAKKKAKGAPANG